MGLVSESFFEHIGRAVEKKRRDDDWVERLKAQRENQHAAKSSATADDLCIDEYASSGDQ